MAKKTRIISYPITEDSLPKTHLLIRCLDRRFRIAHARFAIKELGIKPGNAIPIRRAGGIGPLRQKRRGIKKIPSDVIAQIDLFLEHHQEIVTIAVFNHQDCKRYDKMRKRCKLPDPELREVIQATKLLAKRYRKKKIAGGTRRIRIKGYFASFVQVRDNRRIVFSRVA